MLVALPLLLGIAITRWAEKYDAALISKVNGDLTIADQYMSQILERTEDRLEALGASVRFQSLVQDPPSLGVFLEESRLAQGLDFLYLVGVAGQVEAAAPPAVDPRQTDWPIIRAALSGVPATSIDLYQTEDLAAISPKLAERSRFDLVATPNAIATDRRQETRGMIIHSAAPVMIRGADAALVGGILLNRNLVFIDTINDLVYRKASLPEGSVGTATLFLDDVRVSTNVRLFEGSRALGTRVSAEVRKSVLDEGRTWLDRAFVVNDWYISAYEPLVDSYGRRIGMLYVGFLEAPFQRTKTETMLTIVVAFLAISAASIPFMLRWARGIFKPLERMSRTIASVEQGDLSARTGLPPAGDEIGRVAGHLDDLLDRLQQRERSLREWNDELNRRVEERTGELQRANTQLEATTKQLIMSEKLAAIGEITAGVAHEINNPVAVMQGNLEVVRTVLDDKAADVETELQLLDEQTNRISQIVTKLLQFARPEEYAESSERHPPDRIVEDCLPLVKHLLAKSDIEVLQSHTATRQIQMNRTELQQVLVNLMVNAIHAMPDGGTLKLVTSDGDGTPPGVTLSVADTGMGMAPDVLARIFDPFYTTKRREGTGLGLSISQTLISRQGGVIDVSSDLGEGTTFTIWLPEAS